MDTKEKESVNFFNDILMGPNGPLYWILIMAMVGIPCILVPKIIDRRDCLSLGDNYIYIDAFPPCYRVIDGQMHYVNVRKEHALRDYQKSKRLQHNVDLRR